MRCRSLAAHGKVPLQYRIAGTALAVWLVAVGPAKAAERAGVDLPDTVQVAGIRLVLNGIALRTYSILGIRIYVAGLYLEQRSSNAAAILHSPETKLLVIRFLRNVSQRSAQQAWRSGFANNCAAPCRLTPGDIATFLGHVPAIHKGDLSEFLFTPYGLTVMFNGRVAGTTTNHYFAQQILRTFLGPTPPTPAVKRELLGGR